MSQETINSIRTKIRKAELEWRAKLNDMKLEVDSLTAEEQDLLLRQPNLALATGKTRGALTWLITKYISKKIYTSPILGVGLQAKVEHIRKFTFQMGFLKAKAMGYSDRAAIMYGYNMVGYKHAFYGRGARAHSSNKKLGGLMNMFTQHVTNAMLQFYNLRDQAIKQSIRHTPISGSLKEKLLAKWKLLYKRNLYTPTEMKRLQKTKGKDYSDIGELSVAHALFLRLTIAAMQLQVGKIIFQKTGLYNIAYMPMTLIYNTIEFIADMFDDDDEDWELQEVLYQLSQILFWMGFGSKLAIAPAVAIDEDKNLSQTLIQGRIQNSVEILERAINLHSDDGFANPFTNNKTLADPTYLIDKIITGHKILGKRATNTTTKRFTINSPILGSRQVEMKPLNIGVYKEFGKPIDFEDRFKMALPWMYWQSYVPFGHRIKSVELK